MGSLKGKVIAITGAASGIGLATAKACANEGASLSLSDIQEKALQAAVDSFKSQGVETFSKVVDVADSDSVDKWITGTVSHFGKLDGAANIAGIEGPGKVFANFTEMDNKTWDKVLSINLTGVFYSMRAQLRVMQKGAAVVNCASLAGLMGRPGIGAYSVSKHGVVGLTRTAAKEVGIRGIRVNAVAP